MTDQTQAVTWETADHPVALELVANARGRARACRSRGVDPVPLRDLRNDYGAPGIEGRTCRNPWEAPV